MTSNPTSSLTNDEVTHLCGDIPDWKTAAILKIGAGVEDLELALAWAYGESDVAGEARMPLTGHAAAIYEILLGDREQWEEER